ncbi:MAG TPA: hypothetical protein PK839_09950 [Tenuifilaceae bacterium]|nr:hypothetical protein [Bacteroidales bacterium]HNT42039.1 hypothetical protein [Tenuifilaceae bacterium]NLI88389.1 hypothetical protein [Bacteroidales bacterium]HOC37323.1 hypothetical protein [Tenuifilaceae bacterium]HOG73096.1 hypothetical protein [Tenuifilaceae bacterium]
MRNILTTFVFLCLSLPAISRVGGVEIFFAIKPSDCISCMAPIRDILAEIEKQELMEQVTFIVRDVPEKALPKYTKEVLKIPNSINVVSSEPLFSKYSFYNASAITVIDNSTVPIQRITFPLAYYFVNKTMFVERLSKSNKTIVALERVKLKESLGGIRMLSISNDSLLFINDRLFNTISLFSAGSGKLVGNFTLDSAWYAAPYSKDTFKLRQIWMNQHVLERASYPQYYFKGVFNHRGRTIISAICYYPFTTGKDFFILPKNLFFMLDTLLMPISYRWLYIDKETPIVNFYNAVFFQDDNLITTTFDVVNNRLNFNPDFLYYFKPEGDSLIFDKSLHVEPPSFIKNGYSMNGFSLNYISEYMGNITVWFSYYPEFFDLRLEKWVSIDTGYVDSKISTNTFEQGQPVNFQVLGVWAEANQYSMILRFGLQVYYMVQADKNIIQSALIYTLSEGNQLQMVRKSKNEFVGTDYNSKTGDTEIIKFTINGVQTFISPSLNEACAFVVPM